MKDGFVIVLALVLSSGSRLLDLIRDERSTSFVLLLRTDTLFSLIGLFIAFESEKNLVHLN